LRPFLIVFHILLLRTAHSTSVPEQHKNSTDTERIGTDCSVDHMISSSDEGAHYEGTWGSGYLAPLIHNSALDKYGLLHAPTALHLENDPWSPSTKRLGELKCRSEEKKFALSGNRKIVPQPRSPRLITVLTKQFRNRRYCTECECHCWGLQPCYSTGLYRNIF
jgi:hypothetical protein